ncbi:flagellar assembly protein FliH [Buchnera aphidicola]|uniref:Flagellar assembly protein FliH n=1 Tax=Buchnera aphidicola subsp. Uroleucon sonchi TaxID=118118 RepID=A0A6C1F5X5_BUCUN|nr:flagellar assembly protein FliH [Buchnera aphidicola]QIE01831.1 flagellar assembly protein FliH [Buchnera aphidicola (Uroleucon sonchi)]
MSNLNTNKKWVNWFPEEVFLKNINNNQTILYNIEKIKKEDFCINNNVNNISKELSINKTNTEIHKEAFKKGFLEGKMAHDILTKKLNNLCLSFEKDLSTFENQLYSAVLKIVIKISSYIIGKNINIDQSILIKNIKKIFNENGSFLKHPRILVHPDNKILLENTFKKFIKNYQWRLEYDDNIDINGCKVISEDSYIDSTVDARWEELYRLIFSEEY